MKYALVFAAVALVGASAASAQGLSADQLRSRFDSHRGLVIAPTQPRTNTATGPTTQPTTPTETADVVPVDYTPLPEDVAVNFSITFDVDSAALRDDQVPKLATLCEVITGDEEGGVYRIVGHTDASGPASYNRTLSELRAQEVKRHLVDECDIPEERLEALGVGEEFLLNDDDPSAEINRRVEFQAVG